MAAVSVHSVEQLLREVEQRPGPTIDLTLPALSSDEAKLWEARLNTALHSCGCDEGALGMLAGTAVSLSSVLLAWPFSLPALAAIPLVVGTAVSGAAAGKLLGKARGRRRARRTARALASALARRESNVDEQQGAASHERG